VKQNRIGSSPRKRSPIFAKVAPEGLSPRGTVWGEKGLASNLQRFRETLMMTKAELARKAGLSALTIDRVEAGRPCRLGTKRKILQALQLPIDDQDRVFGAPWERMPDTPIATPDLPQAVR